MAASASTCGSRRRTKGAVDYLEVRHPVGVSPRHQRFERADLVRGGDDQLAATLARHAVLLAEGVQPLASLDAEDGLQGIPRVIDAGMDDAAVVVRQANWRRTAGGSPAERRSNQPLSPRVMRRSL